MREKSILFYACSYFTDRRALVMRGSNSAAERARSAEEAAAGCTGADVKRLTRRGRAAPWERFGNAMEFFRALRRYRPRTSALAFYGELSFVAALASRRGVERRGKRNRAAGDAVLAA